MTESSIPYATAQDLWASMPDLPFQDDANYTTLAEGLLLRASRAIDEITKRHSGAYQAVSSTRTFDGSGKSVQWIDEVADDPTKVEVAETGDLSSYTLWTAGVDYMPWPYNAPGVGEPYIRLDIPTFGSTKYMWPVWKKSIKIEAPFGYSLVPPAIVVQATLIQSARWFKRSLQAWADSAMIPELSQIRYMKQLDPDVELLLDRITRKVI